MSSYLTEHKLMSNQFISYEAQPRPPVCYESEWRFLLFLHNAIQQESTIPFEDIMLYSLESGNHLGPFSGVRKTSGFGLRTYLVPDYDKEKIWIASPGHKMEGIHSHKTDPLKRYLLRPVIDMPNIEVLKSLQPIFNISEWTFNTFKRDVEKYGCNNLLRAYIAQVSHTY